MSKFNILLNNLRNINVASTLDLFVNNLQFVKFRIKIKIYPYSYCFLEIVKNTRKLYTRYTYLRYTVYIQ